MRSPRCQIVAGEARIRAAMEPPTAVQVFGARNWVRVSIGDGIQGRKAKSAVSAK